VSERVVFRSQAGVQPDREGWALNMSRGGLRAILDDGGKVELGEEYEIFVGPAIDEATGKRGRIVWLQEEPDGFVVGVEYVGLSGTHAAAPTAPPGALTAEASGASPASSAAAAPSSRQKPETD